VQSCDAVHESFAYRPVSLFFIALVWISILQITDLRLFLSPPHQDLKQPYHLLNKNNEELKRLAAVESLMEVSAEENVSLCCDLSRDTFGFRVFPPSNDCIPSLVCV
jgi:hypothetical protein